MLLSVKPKAVANSVLGPDYFVGTVRRLARRNKLSWSGYVRDLAGRSMRLSRYKRAPRGEGWAEERTYNLHYVHQFRHALETFFGSRKKGDLVSILSSKRKKQVNVLEDGPGKGTAMKQFREKLEKKGVTPYIVGVHVERRNPWLEKRKAQGVFDELHHGLAEHYVPTRKFDCIISFFGSVFHAPKFVQAEHIKKFAFSLNRGGIFVAAIHASPVLNSTEVEKQVLGRRIKQVERFLKPLGFKVGLYATPPIDVERVSSAAQSKWRDPRGLGNLADYTLIIQRL